MITSPPADLGLPQPQGTPLEKAWQPAFAAAELGEGQMRACVIAGRDLLVCHTSDGIFAVDEICTHAFAHLREGRLRGNRLICPLHGASFDVCTGRVLGAPAMRPLAGHAVRIREGSVQIRLAGSQDALPTG